MFCITFCYCSKLNQFYKKVKTYIHVVVYTDFENKAAWKVCLESKGIILPTGYYFGVTAATGDLSDNHDLFSVRLFELDVPDDGKDFQDRSNVLPSAVFFEPPRGKVFFFLNWKNFIQFCNLKYNC